MKTTRTTSITTQELNPKATHPRLMSKFTKSIGRMLLVGAVLGLALSARAQVTYTYTGNPFSYNGSAYSYVTHISGSFTVASPLAANSFYTNSGLTLGKSGGGTGPAIGNYSFSDGKYINNFANYSTTGGPGGEWGNGTGSGTTIFDVTTGADGNITSWYLNILSSTAQMNTFDCPASYPYGASVSDQVTAEPSSPYDAYNFGSPGTWSVTGVPEPGTLSLMTLGLGGLALLRKSRQGVR